MKKIIRYTLATILSLGVFSSCVVEDDYEIPIYKKMLLSETFESLPAGGGTTELPVILDGWINTNIGTGTRLWHVRAFNNNKFADFSSNFSEAGVTDENWLITPEVSITKPSLFRFSTEVRFHNYDNLSVWISTDYDGTVEGISTATWVQLDAFISGSAQNGNNIFTSSGDIDLSEYVGSDIRIGFKYTGIGGSSSSQSSTYRVDNITIFEN